MVQWINTERAAKINRSNSEPVFNVDRITVYLDGFWFDDVKSLTMIDRMEL